MLGVGFDWWGGGGVGGWEKQALGRPIARVIWKEGVAWGCR